MIRRAGTQQMRYWIEKMHKSGLFCLLWTVPLFGQPNPSAERLRLVYADSLIGMVIQGKPANKLSGNVRMVQGTAFLTCKEAVWYEKENRITLLQDVVVHDGKRTLRADRVDYDGEKKVEEASGNAVLENDRRKIIARVLTYLQSEERVFAQGAARAEDLMEKAMLEGDRMMYDRRKDYCLVEQGPSLVKTDTLSHKTWTITGKTMQVWGGEQRALVSDSVVIHQEDLKGICRKAEYFSKPERIVLTGTPVVWQKSRKMQGDSMIVRLNGTRFEGAVLYGRARIASTDSTGENLLKGETITIESAGDTLRHITVEGRAESLLHVSNEKGVKQGINSTSGDRMDLFFEKEALKKATVVSHPGLSEGTYSPDKETAVP